MYLIDNEIKGNSAHLVVNYREGSLIARVVAISPILFGMVWWLSVLDISPLWWKSSAALFILIIFWALFRQPIKTFFKADVRTIEQIYRCQLLAPKRSLSSFSDWTAIQSRLAVEHEDPMIQLELVSANGNRLVLAIRTPCIDRHGSMLSWDRYLEPGELRACRKDIASFVGLEDAGFHRPTF